MLYVFDLDGTLIDNKLAIYAAYQGAGVKPPSDFFTTPSHKWKRPPTEEQKALKNKVYAATIPQRCKVGPAFTLWHALHEDIRTILTGASGDSVKITLQALNITSTFLCKKSLPDKVHTLRALKEFHGSGKVFYVDADNQVCQYVSQEAGITGITFHSGE